MQRRTIVNLPFISLNISAIVLLSLVMLAFN